MKYDLLVYIGRFQPFHNGHKDVIDTALSQSERVCIVIGSHNRPRSPKNPWTSEERVQMIRSCFPEEVQHRLSFAPVVDHLYNFDRWLAAVDSAVTSTKFMYNTGLKPFKIGLIGLNKDQSSFYLHHFPQWESVPYTPKKMINATDIRNEFFSPSVLFDTVDDLRKKNSILSKHLSEEILDSMIMFSQTPAFQSLWEEQQFLLKHKEMWSKAPYPPTFQTADAIVVQAGHVLLVERADCPGRGLLAIPGGYVGQNESVETAALRELKEETKIDVPMAVLKGSIAKSRMFDDPSRSERGRIITQAYLIRLNDKVLPKVKGDSDAKKAVWTPISNLNRNKLFEDHFDILETMVSI